MVGDFIHSIFIHSISIHFTQTAIRVDLMPGPGPTLTQLAQNVGEGATASGKRAGETCANLFFLAATWGIVASLKPKLKPNAGSFLRPKSPDNLAPLTCRHHSWSFMLGQWNLSRWWMELALSRLVMRLGLVILWMGMMLAVVKLQLSLLQLPMQPGDGVLSVFLKARYSAGIAWNEVETVQNMLHLMSLKILHLEIYQNLRWTHGNPKSFKSYMIFSSYHVVTRVVTAPPCFQSIGVKWYAERFVQWQLRSCSRKAGQSLKFKTQFDSSLIRLPLTCCLETCRLAYSPYRWSSWNGPCDWWRDLLGGIWTPLCPRSQAALTSRKCHVTCRTDLSILCTLCDIFILYDMRYYKTI